MDLVFFLGGGVKTKFCLLLISAFYPIEFILLSYVIKILSEITIVLIESNQIYINHTHSWARKGCSLDAYPSAFPDPTRVCSKPVCGIKHVLYMHLLNVRAVQWSHCTLSLLFGIIKICNLQLHSNVSWNYRPVL